MTINFRRIVSFARRRTHNKAKEDQIIQNLLPSFAVKSGEINNLSDVFNQESKQSYILEIGFGSGENILHMSKENPQNAYIGCEVFTAGVTKVLEDIKNEEIKNIRLWHNDALELIPNLPDNSLQLVYILHPDPWPKKKHNKRRLINVEFLKVIANKIAVNGKILMITDHADYAEHIALEIKNIDGVYNQVFSDYPPIVKTKYRLKADAQNIESHYFCLVKSSL